jgi:glycosyltransferase involved in cell wall biosynthesis
MRVCHVAHGDLWAGAEVHLATLLEALLDVPDLELSAVLLHEGRLAEVLRGQRIRTVVFDERRSSAWKILGDLVEYFKRERPDLVHTHKYKDNMLAAMAGWWTGVPGLVRIVHGMPEPFHGMRRLRMAAYEYVDGLVNRYAVDSIIAVSANIEQRLVERFGSSKVVRIHNGIDLRQVGSSLPLETVRRQLGLMSDDMVVGSVGRLTPVKGQSTLIEAVAILKRGGWNVKGLIVGEGPLRSELRELATQKGIEKDVVLAGERRDVYDLINAMDVFVLPSLHEGIPMVLLEALASGKPVVASRVGGIPDVIRDGIDGLLVPAGDAVALSKTVDGLLKDRSTAERLGRAGRIRVESEFAAPRMAQKTLELYRAVMSEVRPAAGR